MNGTILVIDDEPLAREATEAQLAVDGHRVQTAASGREGLELAARCAPDVVLLDVMMPELNGFEVCARLKETTPHLPVILLTALTDREYLARGLDAGADEFVTKPVLGIELRARVRSMLRVRRGFDELQRLLRLREDFVHMVVHDMRSPLSAIRLATAMALEAPALDAEVRRDLEGIARAASQVEHLANDMLVMAKLEDGQLQLRRARVEASVLLGEAIEASQHRAGNRGVVIATEIVPGTRLEVDPELFARVIDNLLTNAIKFSPRNSRVILRAGPDDVGRVVVSVADEGHGIDPRHREHVFEKYRVVPRTGEHVPQTGLGLAFCRMVVEAHGGTIRVESNAPSGSVFAIQLPRRPEASA